MKRKKKKEKKKNWESEVLTEEFNDWKNSPMIERTVLWLKEPFYL